MQRRDLFKILAATAVPANAAEYQPRFFTATQYTLIDALCEVILPADAQSAGAHEAKVAFYLDTVLFHSPAPLQAAWRRGVEAAQAAPGTPAEVVARIAAAESAPSTELERFFGPLKQLTIEAYALSEIGMRQHFGYRGDTAIGEFRGCTHPEHQR
jgi:hypothetical protein